MFPVGLGCVRTLTGMYGAGKESATPIHDCGKVSTGEELKILRGRPRAGSSPAVRTRKINNLSYQTR